MESLNKGEKIERNKQEEKRVTNEGMPICLSSFVVCTKASKNKLYQRAQEPKSINLNPFIGRLLIKLTKDFT